MERIKLTISFKESEIELFNYIKSKRSYSNFIKDLVEECMKREQEGKDYARDKHY